MKFTTSGVHDAAAQTKSPSFSAIFVVNEDEDFAASENLDGFFG